MNSTEESAIKIERTEEFHEAARELSDYIRGLDLPKPQNDALIKLILAQVHHAGAGALAQGFRMGMEFRKGNRFRRKKDTSLEDMIRLLRP